MLPATDKTTQFNPYEYDPESFNPYSKGLAFRHEEDKNLQVFPRSFVIDPNGTIYNTFYLRDFYFDYGNIVKRPDLFVNGPWDFMMKFFEDPDVQGVVGTINAGNAGVKPYYNYKTKKVTDVGYRVGVVRELNGIIVDSNGNTVGVHQFFGE